MTDIKDCSLIELYENGADMGNFYPLHHVFVAFPGEQEARQAQAALLEDGFSAADCRVFNNREVADATQRGLDSAPLWGATGASLKDVQLQHQLALEGCHFLLVNAPSEAETESVMHAAHQGHFRVAQKYRRLVVEQLH